MSQVVIPWAGQPLNCKRIVLNSALPGASMVKGLAAKLGLDLIEDDVSTIPQAGDLWVGLCPKNGWYGREGECGEARTLEIGIVINRLASAQEV